MKRLIQIILVTLIANTGWGQILFSEPFTSNLGQMTASNGSNGNWMFTTSCARNSLAGHSTLGTANFIGSGCNFGNGGLTVSGNLTSPSIAIPSSGAVLSFNYGINTECGTSGTCYYDVLSVLISNNGGVSYTTVASSSGSPLAINANTGWSTFTLSLNTYSNQNILIRYNFNSLDGVLNAYDGVYVDDITVTSNCTPPNVTVAVTNSAICNGQSATITANGATSYTWLPGNQNTSSITVSPTTSTTYTLIGKTGCATTKTIAVQVNPVPTVSMAVSASVICNGASISFTGTGASTYTWLPNNYTGSVVTVAPSSNTTFTLKGASSFGCVGTQTLPIVVNPIPTVNIASTTPTICAGNSVNLTASGANTYTWLPGNMTGGSIAVSPTINTSYYVVGMSSAGCLGNASYNITVYSLPSLSVTSTSNSICVNATVQLNASGAANYTWMPGNVNSISVMMSPNASTTYTLNGKDNLGCVNSKTLQIVVNPNPTININVTNPTICSGNTTSMNAVGASTYTWLPMNSNGSGVLVNPTSSTIYTVIGSSLLGCTSSNTTQVNVNPLPVINLNASTSTLCEGSTAQLNASGALSYTWIPGNQLSPVINVTPSVTTIYTVTGTSSLGCINSQTISIAVYALPAVTVSPSYTAICSGSSLTLNANGANSYTWQPGLLSGSNVTVTPSSSTIYTLTGMSALGCENSVTVPVTVNSIPNISVSANYTAVCLGDTVQLSANGAQTYNWQPNNTNGAVLVDSPTITTTYSVSGTSSQGCTGISTIAVVVNTLPVININTSNNPICYGDSTLLTASGAQTYTWLPMNANTISQMVSPSLSTTYSVYATSNLGCVNSAAVSITVNALPVITTSVSNNVICQGDSINIYASGAVNYTWSPLNSNAAMVMDAPLTNQSYTVTGTSIDGCVSNAIIGVTVNPLPVVIINSTNQTICNGDSTQLIASGAISYSWASLNYTTSLITVYPNTNTVYTVTGLSSQGCINTQTYNINVNPIPQINITTTSDTVCAGSLVSLIANGANTYTWLPVNMSTTSINDYPATNTTYSVIGDLAGCIGYASKTIVVNSLPTLTLNSNNLQVCPNTNVSLIAAGALNFTWMPGNLSGNSVIVSANNAITYTITGADGNGCIDTALVNIGILPTPVLTVSSSSSVICVGSSAELACTGANTYSWLPMNSTGNSVIVSPLVSTTYTVSGTGLNGCSSTATLTQVVDNCTKLSIPSKSKMNYNIYPNPSNGNVYIQIDDLMPETEIEIYNLIGQKVANEKVIQSVQRIELKLSKGIYIVKVIVNKDDEFSRKLIIE